VFRTRFAEPKEKHMRWTVCAAALIVLATATTRADDARKKDTEVIQGTWEPVGLILAGKPEATPAKDLPTRIFDGEKLTTKDPGKKTEEQATFKLDATKEPKQIDIMPKGGKTVQGIYTLDGDTLKIAYKIGGQERPTNLNGEGVFVETLKRQVKK
jgi:uncharacterized protein (TIGR03067 family)